MRRSAMRSSEFERCFVSLRGVQYASASIGCLVRGSRGRRAVCSRGPNRKARAIEAWNGNRRGPARGPRVQTVLYVHVP